MKKRILSFLMVLTLLIGCMTFTANADSEIYGVEALTHLQNLGIFSPTLEADDVMTRGEFANSVYKMVGKNIVYDTNFVFYDVGDAHPYAAAINYCAQNGYMTGDAGFFRPDDSITYIEGMTVIARVLNYTEYARNNGDYTLGYYTTAKNIGLLKNTGITSSNDPMLVGNAAAMFYNALRCNASKLVSINSFYHQYVDSNKVFAYEALGLNYAKGVMTSNGDCDITDKGNTGKNTIIVDNVQYNSKLLDGSYKFYLGQEVSLFYDVDGNVVSIAPTGTSSVINFTKRDFSSKIGNTVKYYVDDNDYKANLSKAPTYLKNGETVVDFKATGFSNAEFADMTLVDSNADGEYDYVFVNVYDTFVVNSVSSDYVLTSVNNTYKVDLGGENGKKVYVFDGNGNMKSRENIYKDYVVSVMETDEFVYVVYTNSKVSGTVTEKDEYTVSIDQMEIDVPNGTKDYFKDISYGDTVTVYFDFAGRAVYVIDGYVSDIKEPLGFLVDAQPKPGFDKKVQIKMLTSAGNIEVLELGDRFRVDGKQHKRSEMTDVSLFMKDGNVNNTVVMYNTDDNGKLVSITFPKSSLNYNEDGFMKSASREKAQLLSNGMLTLSTKKDDGTYFSGYEFINANTLIFLVPENKDDEEAFGVTAKSYLPLSNSMTWDVFHLSKYNGYADAAVIYGEYANTSYDSSMTIVLSVGKGYDAKGNEVTVIKGYTDNNEKMYYAPDGVKFSEYKFDDLGNKANVTFDAANVKPGDLVRLGTDKNGNVRQGERIYEYNAIKHAFKGSAKQQLYASGSLFITSGYVAFNDGAIFRVADNKDSAMTLDGDIFKTQGLLFGSAKIYFVTDTKRGVEVNIGSIDDVEIGDYVVCQARTGVTRYIVVFKDKQ